MTASRARRGFVLVSVLWVLAASSALVVDIGLEVALDLKASTNRVMAERAYWRAAGCAAVMRARLTAHLARTTGDAERRRAWNELDRAVTGESASITGCSVEAEASGTRLPLNQASGVQLRRLVRALDFAETPERVVSAILTRRLATSFSDPRELRMVIPRVADADRLAEFVSADSAIVSLNHAGREVLLAVGGLPSEAVDRLLSRRSFGLRLASHRELEDGLSSHATEDVRRNMPSISALTATEPESWVIRVSPVGSAGAPPHSLEERVIRTDRGLAIIEVRLP